ncbi:EcKinase 3 [Hyalella azteca]|uniref:EcKinase 3 n=1 Tax=Hyalella azteca TaxID=294128 RepID=A0A6A0H7S1_HYAAZ|nr:EcKinase 3 [Hyalella azteca]
MASQFTKASSCDSGSSRRSSYDAEDRASTREWLETILTSFHRTKESINSTEIEVHDWRIGTVRCGPPVNKCGQMSHRAPSKEEEARGDYEVSSLMELLAVHAEYSLDSSPRSLDMVAKLPPADDMSRAFMLEWALDTREIRFYTENSFLLQVLPALEAIIPALPLPICYYASCSEKSESVLVLEDLTSKGFFTESLSKGLSLPQGIAAVKALAKVHAASFLYSAKNNYDIRQKFPYLLTAAQASASFHSLVERGLPLLIKFLQKKSQYKTTREKLQKYQEGTRMAEVIQKAFKPSPKLNTLVHCDFWANNLLFAGEEPQILCCLIDWQLVTYGSPAIDLALLLSTSFTPDVRRDSRHTLLSVYWSDFSAHVADGGGAELLKNCALEDLMDDMTRAEAMSALVMVGSVDLALGVPEREDRVLSILNDFFEAEIL